MARITFKKNLNKVNEKIEHWKKNLLVLPSGTARRENVEKVMNLKELWIQNAALNSILL